MVTNFITTRFNNIIKEMPEYLQERATHLPYLLGLVENENDRWEDYTKIQISYDLVGLVIQDLYEKSDLSIFTTKLEQFRYLHLHILLYFICQDRIADGDITGNTFFDELCCFFKAKIILTLNDITNQKGELYFEEYYQCWKNGVSSEKEAIRCGMLSTKEYGLIIRAKNRYLTMATRIFLCYNRPDNQSSVEISKKIVCIIDGMITALQCRGDSLSETEDREHFGVSFSELLNCRCEELYDSATLIMQKLFEYSLKHGWLNLSDGVQECLEQKFMIEAESVSNLNIITNQTKIKAKQISSAYMALNMFPQLSLIIT